MTDSRSEAGAAYRAAAEAYVNAWVELHAHDLALNSEQRFAEPPALAAHSQFLPRPGVFLDDRPHDRAVARHEELRSR